jgi:adenosylcobinamide-GDP ribazoletransferase
MKFIKGFYMSLGMFCGVPLPFYIWEEKLGPIMVAALPVVGLVVGLLWYLLALASLALPISVMLSAAAITLAPFFAAGFIHLDGYMDTSDAVLSYRSIEERQRILKDPLVGSFAVVMLAILFLAQFAAMHTVVENGQYLALIILISVISRCCSAFSVFFLRHSHQSNYASMMSQNISVGNKLFVVLVAAVAAHLSYLYAGNVGSTVVVTVILSYAFAMKRVYKSLDGISGDLLGYSMVISEVCGLIAFAVLT